MKWLSVPFQAHCPFPKGHSGLAQKGTVTKSEVLSDNIPATVGIHEIIMSVADAGNMVPLNSEHHICSHPFPHWSKNHFLQ